MQKTAIFLTLVRAHGAGLRGEWNMIPRVPQVKSRQSDNMPKVPRTTSIHATAKFLKGMKLITSAEFFLKFLHSNIDKNSVYERMEFICGHMCRC